MCEGHTLGDDQSVQTDIETDWQTQLGGFLEHHTGHQQLSHSFDIAFIIECTKHQYAYKYFADDEHSTLLLYRTLHPEYKYADYLSAVKCWSNRRLISRFRGGCMGCELIQGVGPAVFIFIGKTGCVWCASHCRKWRTSNTFCFSVQRTITLGQSMQAYFSKYSQCQTSLLGLSVREWFSSRNSILNE